MMSKRRRGRKLAKQRAARMVEHGQNPTAPQQTETGPRDDQSKLDRYCKVATLAFTGCNLIEKVWPWLKLMYDAIIRHLPCKQSGRCVRFQILRPASSLAGRIVLQRYKSAYEEVSEGEYQTT